MLKRFGQSVLINGKPLQVGKEGNSRIAIFKQGTVIIPHGDDYRPLGTFTEKSYGGKSVYYSLATYYTNKGSANIPTTMVQPLEQDNHIRSFKLKKGYMATFSTASDGIGYSRVFIADTADVLFSSMPVELDQNISFIRVFPWQWPSKKGWCGGRGGIVQSNGENRQDNEINLTQSTWFYSWGWKRPCKFKCGICSNEMGVPGVKWMRLILEAM